MKNWLIKKLGGYPDIDSALRVVNEHDDRNKILTEAVKRLFNIIGIEDILQEKPDGWYLADKKMDKAQVGLLFAEGTHFKRSKLWKALQIDIKYQANKMMFLNAETKEQIAGGKLCQFILDTISTRLGQMEKDSIKLNKTTRS